MKPLNIFPRGQYPTTKDLAAAIKDLPTPAEDVAPQQVDIDAGLGDGRYNVTFVTRLNATLSKPTWFWGVKSSEPAGS
jgi:hypothetical protein